jgi:hypothetical protein
VSFVAATLCIASHRVFIVVSVISLSTQSGNFWIHPRYEVDHLSPLGAEINNQW